MRLEKWRHSTGFSQRHRITSTTPKQYSSHASEVSQQHAAPIHNAAPTSQLPNRQVYTKPWFCLKIQYVVSHKRCTNTFSKAVHCWNKVSTMAFSWHLTQKICMDKHKWLNLKEVCCGAKRKKVEGLNINPCGTSLSLFKHCCCQNARFSSTFKCACDVSKHFVEMNMWENLKTAKK